MNTKPPSTLLSSNHSNQSLNFSCTCAVRSTCQGDIVAECVEGKGLTLKTATAMMMAASMRRIMATLTWFFRIVYHVRTGSSPASLRAPPAPDSEPSSSTSTNGAFMRCFRLCASLTMAMTPLFCLCCASIYVLCPTRSMRSIN